MENQDNNTILDFEIALKAVAGNELLAQNLLKAFMAQIQEYKGKITHDLKSDDREKLQNTIHKLHGATQYLGVPMLRQIVSNLDGAMQSFNRNNLQVKIDSVIEQLDLIEKEKVYFQT